MRSASNVLALAFVSGSALAADVNAALSGVSSEAAGIKSQVDNWSSGAGLAGALGIQQSVPKLESSVNALSSAVQGAKDSDVDASTAKSTLAEISGLLEALTHKAADFSAVGAKSIVGNDISSLVGPAEGIVSGIYSAISDDCSKVDELTSALSTFSKDFASAGSAYGVSGGDFPSTFTCGNGGSTKSSASGSASATKKVESVGAAAPTGAAIPASFNGTGTYSPKSGNGTFSQGAINPHNAGSKVQPIAVGLAAAAGAMLLL